MRTPVILPDLGVGPVRFSLWLAEAGELVLAGDRVAEVLARGASFDVASPASGRLVGRAAWPADLLKPGQVLAEIETPDLGLPPASPSCGSLRPSTPFSPG